MSSSEGDVAVKTWAQTWILEKQFIQMRVILSMSTVFFNCGEVSI